MDRAATVTAFQAVEGLEEIVVPKKNGTSEFIVTADDGLKWKPSDGADQLSVTMEAATQALRHVPGLSGTAIREWPTSLLVEPLNWWFRHGSGEARALYNADGEVLSFTKRAEAGIQRPTRMLEAVEDALGEKGIATDDLYYDKVRVGLDQVSFAVITHEKTEEVKAGDVFDAGIMVFGSPTGEAHVEVSPYLNRVFCTNGMISPVAIGRYSHRGSDGASIYDWTRDMTVQAWDAIDNEIDAVRSLTGIPVDGNVHAVMADLFDRHHVPARQREAVLEALVEESDGTMFGVSQSFNRVANDVEDVSGLRHLLMVSGDVAHQTERCTACMRALN